MPEEDNEANNSKIEDPSKMTADEKNEVEEKVGEAIEENFVSLEKKDEKAEEKKEEPKEGEASGSCVWLPDHLPQPGLHAEHQLSPYPLR